MCVYVFVGKKVVLWVLRISKTKVTKKRTLLFTKRMNTRCNFLKNKGTSHTLLKSLVLQRDEILNI